MIYTIKVFKPFNAVFSEFSFCRLGQLLKSGFNWYQCFERGEQFRNTLYLTNKLLEAASLAPSQWPGQPLQLLECGRGRGGRTELENNTGPYKEISLSHLKIL